MTYHIRPEQTADYPAVEQVARDAFYNLYTLGCEEHYVIHRLRSHKDFLPNLTFVIEIEGEIQGSVHGTRSYVEKETGELVPFLTYGPVCIHPRYHRQGFGRKLMTHAIAEGKNQGETAIFIAGYPHHYQCYGFESAKKYAISGEDGAYYRGFMALELEEGALSKMAGKLKFSDAFQVDPNEAAEYDKLFPVKEKKVMASQAQFAKAVEELDLEEYPTSC